MPPPKLPPRDISAPINQISRETWAMLIDAIAYAMTHPAGDGIKILNTPGGLLSLGKIAQTPSGGGSASTVYLATIVTPPNGYGAAEAVKVIALGGGLTTTDNTVIPVEVWRMHE